jgi:hypothetical protein
MPCPRFNVGGGWGWQAWGCLHIIMTAQRSTVSAAVQMCAVGAAP